jgi:hypothetical protein
MVYFKKQKCDIIFLHVFIEQTVFILGNQCHFFFEDHENYELFLFYHISKIFKMNKKKKALRWNNRHSRGQKTSIYFFFALLF